MVERFGKQARQVAVEAREAAREYGHGRVGTEHLVLGLLRHPACPGVSTLVRLGVTHANCRTAVAHVVGGGDASLGPEDAAALRAFGIDLAEVRRRAEVAFGDGALDAPRSDPGERGRRRVLPLGRRRRRGEAPGGRAAAGTARAAAGTRGHPPFSPRARKALELTLREAVARGDRHIGTEHMVLALLRGEDPISLALFEQLGIERAGVRDVVLPDLRSAA